MLCGCLNKKKATIDHSKETADSPLQIQLIKMFGLKEFILEKFVFRRKPSCISSSIKLMKSKIFREGIESS